jgi:hypothetical protein
LHLWQRNQSARDTQLPNGPGVYRRRHNLAGSGINLWAAQNVLIMNNIIRNNTSPNPGSAFTSANSDNTVLVQNLTYGNTSNCGGAHAFMGSIFAANNTIVDNVTPKASGGSECINIAQIYPGPYSYGSSFPSAVFINNIISGSTSYPAVNCSWFDTPSESDQPTFQNNILYNGGGSFFGSYCVNVSSEYNNITADPSLSVHPRATITSEAHRPRSIADRTASCKHF